MNFVQNTFVCVVLLLGCCFISSFRPSIKLISYLNSHRVLSALPEDADMRPDVKPRAILKHLGEFPTMEPLKDFDKKQRDNFNLNVGRAMEALRRQLPMVFHVSNLDFSIFANEISVADVSNKNKMLMSKSFYSAGVKSLRMAASLSFTQPTMNVRKIEYLEDSRTIQCLVEMVLPDTVRIDGLSIWEGMFYFGLDVEGLIDTHIFDRRISNFKPSTISTKSYPWLRATPRWSAEAIVGASRYRSAEEFVEELFITPVDLDDEGAVNRPAIGNDKEHQ